MKTACSHNGRDGLRAVRGTRPTGKAAAATFPAAAVFLRGAVLCAALAAAVADERLDLLVNSLRTEGNKKYVEGVQAALAREGAPAVPGLIDLLKDQNADVRYRAAAVLMEIGDPRARRPIEGLLDDPSEKVRGLAVKAVGALKSDAAVAKLLLPLADNDSQAFRRSVRNSVLSIGAAAVPHLASMLDHRDPTVRVWAMGCLVELGGVPCDRLEDLFAAGDISMRVACVDAAGSMGYAPLVEKALRDGSGAVRRHATHALASLPGPQSGALLARMAGEEPDPAVRRQAVLGLGRAGHSDAVARLAGLARDNAADRAAAVFALGLTHSHAAHPVLLASLGDGDPAVRRNAALGLGKLPPESAADASTPVVRGLVGALADPDASVRAAARSALTAAAGDRPARAICEAFVAEERHHVARELSMALVELGAAAEPFLLKALDSGSENTRALAAEALGLARSPSAAQPLAALLADAAPAPLRRSAMLALSMIGAPAVEPLMRLLGAGPDAVAERARRVLAEMKDAATRAAVTKALSDASPRVRAAAASILGAQGEGESVPELIWTLENDSDINVRVGVARALGRLGNRLAANSLARACANPSAALRREAALAIGKIGDSRNTAVLERLLEDDDPSVIQAAQASLDEVRRKSGGGR